MAILLLSISMCSLAQQNVNVAVAANFKPTLELLVEHYEQLNPQANIIISSASTGVLFAQIQRGAPFDIFLSADSARPKLLALQGMAKVGSQRNYALGQLVLWAPQEQRTSQVNLAKLGGKLAIANPLLAPFGLAAKVALQNLAYWPQIQSQLVMTNNVQQVTQLVASGAAQMGFVALSQVLNVPRGEYWVLPSNLYPPITQQMVLIDRQPDGNREHNLAVTDFFDFIMSKQGQRIINLNGYLSAAHQKSPIVKPDVR